MPAKFHSTIYRYPNEQIILLGSIFLVLLVIALTATATVCLSVVFVFFGIMYAYYGGISHHQQLVYSAERVTPGLAPGLSSVIVECQERLQVESVDVFVIHNQAMNAYTFGLSSPKAIVLYDSLLETLDRDEIQFVIGHEMGHILLGHTWLNSLVGGMAGIPASTSASLLLVLVLRWWNRACEFSADRAGVLACSNPAKAISALIKLETGSAKLDSNSIQKALEKIEAQDDSIANNLNELLATHPMIINRIEQLRSFTNSKAYPSLQNQINHNLVNKISHS